MRAVLSADGSMVQLSGAVWSMAFPVSELPRWLAFYRGLMRRRSPRSDVSYASAYGDTVAELERVARDLARGGAP